MIAIGIPQAAYTEHIPVVSEQPHVEQNHEENEGQSSFAEILAGLLQNTRSSNTEDSLDTLAVEKSEDGNKLNVFANVIENNISLSDSDIDLLLSSELSTEHLFGNILNMDDNSENIENISTETVNHFAELAVFTTNFPAQIDMPSVEKVEKIELPAKFPAEALSDTQMNNAANLVKETLPAENQSQSTEPLNRTERVQAQEPQSSPEQAPKVKVEVSLQNEESSQKREDSQHTDTRDRTQEVNTRSTRRDRFSIEVRDLRTGPNTINTVETAANRVTQAGTQEITMDLRLPNYVQSSQAQTSWEVKAGNALENMLARELHQNFNGDIVRHASMALKDGGAGTIKINLHPEHLGNVKIRLEMAENKITGHIFVESQEALNAFRKEIAALEQAFRDSGFADASLDLSLTADGTGSGNGELDESSLAQQLAAFNYEGSYESETESVIDVFFGHTGGRAGSINMLA